MSRFVDDDDAYNYFRHPGDPRIAHLRGAGADTNYRWGAVKKLVKGSGSNSDRRTTVLYIPTFGVPTPIAFQIRFSLDGVTWTNINPSATASVTFKNTAAIDLKAGAIDDEFAVNSGEAQPFSQIITSGINLTATLESENTTDELWVAVSACPVCCYDGADGPGGTVVPTTVQIVEPRGWSSSHEEFFDTTSPGIISPNRASIPANPARASLFISNKSATSNLIVSLGGLATYPPGTINEGSFVLAPGATWEMGARFTGEVTFTCDAGSVGFVTWGEGSYDS